MLPDCQLWNVGRQNTAFLTINLRGSWRGPGLAERLSFPWPSLPSSPVMQQKLSVPQVQNHDMEMRYLHYHFGELPYRLFFFGDVSLITLLSLSVLNALRNYTFRDLNRGTKTST